MLRTIILSIISLSLGLSVAFADSHKTNEIKFPKEYQSFKNYFSGDRLSPNDGQIIRIFANDIALKGMKKNAKLPYGSVIAAEIYKAKKDKDGEVIESNLGRRVRNKLAVIAVMEKRKGFGANVSKEFRNGDWDFAVFKPDGSVAKKDLNKCRACHAPLTEKQHVFSIEHLQ